MDYTGEGIMDAVGVITSAGRDLEDQKEFIMIEI